MFAQLNSPLNGRNPKSKLKEKKTSDVGFGFKFNLSNSSTVDTTNKSKTGTPFPVKTQNPVSISWLRAFQNSDSTDSSCEDDKDDSEENMASICLALANPSIDHGAWSAAWFRERCDADDATNLLVDTEDGGFIIHNNLSEKALGFSYKFDGIVRHTAVEMFEGTVNLFGDRDHPFVTVSDLVHYYTHNWDSATSYSMPCALSSEFRLADDSMVTMSSVPLEISQTDDAERAGGTRQVSNLSNPKSQMSEPSDVQNEIKLLTGRHSSGQQVATKTQTGIAAHIDNAAKESDFYLDTITKVEAREILCGDDCGSFVVYPNKSNAAILNLSYVVAGGGILRTQITMTAGVGIHLLDSGVTFMTLSQLVVHYAGSNSEFPHMLRVPRPCEAKGTRRLPKWLQLQQPKAFTNQMLDYACDGSFVIRSGQGSYDHLVLTYVFKQKAHHEALFVRLGETKTIQYSLQSNAAVVFPTLTALVQHYCATVNSLHCRLCQVTLDETTIEALSDRGSIEETYDESLMHTRIDPKAREAPWLCLHLSKENALANLDRGISGMFVVRRNAQLFATLSVVVKARKVYNAHICESKDGIHLKSSDTVHTNLSKLIHYHQQHDQQGLPISLKTPNVE